MPFLPERAHIEIQILGGGIGGGREGEGLMMEAVRKSLKTGGQGIHVSGHLFTLLLTYLD